MKDFLKKLRKGAVKIVNTLISSLVIVFFSSLRVSKNTKKLSKHRNNECYVFGNGPSLQKVLENHMDYFTDKDLIVANFFATSHHFHTLKPKYYYFIEPNLFQINSLEKLREKFFNISELVDSLNKVTWNLLFFYPSYYRRSFFQSLITNPKIKFIPINLAEIRGFLFFENFVYKNNLGMPRAQNILNAVIFTALNMNYKTIYLYGADFSYMKQLHVNDKNQLCVHENHFYDSKEFVLESESGSLAYRLEADANTLFSHMRLNKYADYLGAKIINCTYGSYIDVYERDTKRFFYDN